MGQPDLPAFESLYAFLEMTRQIDFSGPNSAALEAIVELLDRRIVPAARALAAAPDFFQGFWLQLARAANHPFDRDRPQCHAAGLFLRAHKRTMPSKPRRAALSMRRPSRPCWAGQRCAYHLPGGLPAARWQIFSLAGRRRFLSGCLRTA